MKLPNKYGSISKLSGKRRRPYIVRKSDENGNCSIIGYVASREEGLALLAAYNANPWDIDKAKITLQELFELWQEKKAPKLGKSNQSSLKSAYKHCAPLGGLPYRQIKAYQMQDCIDNCGCGYSTQGAIKNLWGHLDKFALELDVSSFRYSNLLTSEPIPPTSRLPFTNEEISKLWEHQSEAWVDTVLIFIYSGWRISELLALRPEDIDLKAGTMKGGTKTKAGKGRIVPIHPKIRGFIESRLADNAPRLISQNGKPISTTAYRTFWAGVMKLLEMEHTPHECRHTFESMLDSAGGNRKCIDLLMGHTSKDTGNRVYNHKTIEELRATVELISI
ncbi:tyrosine-type recombinase/integrase [Gemmiger formicilis]